MNIDAVKWLADYDKIIDFASLGLTGKEFVLAYDINNPAMYEKLSRHSRSLLVLDDGEFFARWKKKLEVDFLLKKEGVPTLIVCDTVAKAIEEIEKGGTNRVVGLLIEDKSDEFCKVFVNEWERSSMKKFDLVIMNPPYAGKGDPLFMKISKVIYDNCLASHGRLVSINPTSVVDNTYDTVSAKHKEKYGNMNVLDFVYRHELRTAFDAGIGTGICITTFSEDGKHDLWSDFVREKRFGKKNWDMRKAILGKVKPFLTFIENKPTTGLLDSYKDLFWIIDSNTNSRGEKVKEKQKEIGNSKNLVIWAFNRGHVAAVGEHKWDWTTIQSEEYLTVKHEIKNICQFVIPFDFKDDAIAMLKWLNTDFIMFIVNHYKTQMSNSNILFRLLPCPPALDGNYSDEVLMKHFNLTQEEMDWIHSEMNDFGWKVNLGKTEEQLMEYLDEINR